MKNTRSMLLRLLSLFLAFALVAAACGGDDDDDGASSGDDAAADADSGDGGDDASDDDGVGVQEITEEETDTGPISGGTLRYRVQSESDGLNPTGSALSPSGLTMMNAVFDTLAAFDTEGNAVPYLAESFTPNDDFTAWTIKLREGITFHDGLPLDADAAILSYETQRNDPLVGLAVQPFVTEVVKVDDLTYTINLVDSWRFWPATVTGQLGMVASPAWIEAAAEDPTLNQEPVGTGPFVFDSRNQDSVTRFVRNDNYWNGEVYLDAVEFVIVTDPDIATSLFFEDDFAGMHSNDPASIAALRDADGVQNALDDTGEEQFDLLNTSAPPFDDIRARQALTFASPQNNYVALLGLGVTRRADQIFEPNSPYYNPDVVQETDRPDEAVALAAEYCADFPENCTDNKINIERQTSGPSVVQTREAELLAEGWSVAFNVTFQELAEDAHIQEIAFGQYQVADWRQFGAVDPSVDNVWLLCRTVGGISLNWPRFCDEERDALMLEAQSEADPDARAALYQQLAQEIRDDYTYIFYTHTLWDIAYKDNVRDACSRTSPEGVELRCQVNGRTWHDKVWLAE